MKQKKLWKRFSALAAAMLFAVCMVLPASAARDHENAIMNCQLYDSDGLFDEINQEGLTQAIRDTSDAIDMYIAVCILDESGAEMSDDAVMTYADDKYDELFNVQYGEESDGLLLVLDMPTQYIYISTCGLGELYYYNGAADDRITAMQENLKSYLRSEDYFGAVSRFCADAEYYYKQGIPKNAYTYNSDSGQYSYKLNGELVHTEKLPWWFGINWAFWIPCALIAGAVAGLISLAVIKSSYQLKKSLNPSNYISSNDTNFYQQDDVFLRTHTTKTYHDPNRGSGGGGGGGFSHSSGGGFSHGGGGSHW